MDKLELKLINNHEGTAFYDFVVNDVSLYTSLLASDRNPFLADFDFIGCFQPDLSISYVSELIDMFNLKTKSELVDSKIPIFVCPICADVYCGGKSVRVVETETTFIWDKFEIFAFEEIEDCGQYVVFDHCFYPTTITDRYEFEKKEYLKVLKTALQTASIKTDISKYEEKDDPESKFSAGIFDHIRSMVAAYRGRYK